jgi:hypothetical protein
MNATVCGYSGESMYSLGEWHGMETGSVDREVLAWTLIAGWGLAEGQGDSG